jgi:hypothetical protein
MTSIQGSRKSLLLCALLLLAPVVAHAQTWGDSLSKDDRFWSQSGGMARELSLASGGFGMLADTGIKTISVNPYSVDPMFMLQNPAYASHYPGYMWFDVGLTSNLQDGGVGQNFGGVFALTDDFTAGLILARSDAVGFTLVNPNIFGELTNLSQNFSYVPPTNTWQVLGSLQVGETSIGLGMSYASSSSTVPNASSDSGATGSSTASFHQLGLSAGAIYRSMGGTMLDVDGMLLLPSLSATSGSSGELSMTAMGFNARMFIPLKDEFYLVPIADMYYASGSSTFLATPKDLPVSQNFDVGIGVNFWQGGLHVMSGVSLGAYEQTIPAIANVTPELTNSQTIVPRWNISAEWPVLKWLTARFGYFASSGSQTSVMQQGSNSTDTTASGQANLYSPIYGRSTSGFTAGATFNLWRVNIDVTINDESFREGPEAFDGVDFFGFVTIGYRL